ncbi:hypothetical protein ACVWWO_005211 [Bradyrhizobium sp. F1.13.1]
MIQVLNVEHHEHVSEHSFEDAMRAYYDMTGSIEEGFGQVAKTAHSPEEFERIFKAREGSSGFMRFDVIDHEAGLPRLVRAGHVIGPAGSSIASSVCSSRCGCWSRRHPAPSGAIP